MFCLCVRPEKVVHQAGIVVWRCTGVQLGNANAVNDAAESMKTHDIKALTSLGIPVSADPGWWCVRLQYYCSSALLRLACDHVVFTLLLKIPAWWSRKCLRAHFQVIIIGVKSHYCVRRDDRVSREAKLAAFCYHSRVLSRNTRQVCLPALEWSILLLLPDIIPRVTNAQTASTRHILFYMF